MHITSSIYWQTNDSSKYPGARALLSYAKTVLRRSPGGSSCLTPTWVLRWSFVQSFFFMAIIARPSKAGGILTCFCVLCDLSIYAWVLYELQKRSYKWLHISTKSTTTQYAKLRVLLGKDTSFGGYAIWLRAHITRYINNKDIPSWRCVHSRLSA